MYRRLIKKPIVQNKSNVTIIPIEKALKKLPEILENKSSTP